MRFYNWCITKNLKKDASKEEKEAFGLGYEEGGHPKFPQSKMKYIIWTLEEEENLHFHYYIELTEKVSMKWLKEMCEDNTLHCEPRKGTQKQAIDYVKKIGDYADKFNTKVYKEKPWFEIGEKKTQGNRSDLDSMVDMIEEGYLAGDIVRTFRGNGLRHISHIQRGIESMYGLSSIDRTLNMYTREERRAEIERLYRGQSEENA